MASYSVQHLAETAEIVQKLDPDTLEKMVDLLADVRCRPGRLFFLGVGGSAANASHAVNDFRKISGIESYAPTDNVSELTARTNDEGWASVFVEWVKRSRLKSSDPVMIFSVGEASRFAPSFFEEANLVNADTPVCPSADTRSPKRRAIFLDRDGVINRPVIREGKPYPPRSLAEFEILPGVQEACDAFKKLGFLLVIVTNQPDVGRGTLGRELVETLHGWILQQLPIDRVMTCFHGGTKWGDPCNCRKPQPGMLFHAAEELKIDLARSFMIGDRWRDVDCGFNAGCCTIFIDWGYEEKLNRDPDYRARDLLGAARLIDQLESANDART